MACRCSCLQAVALWAALSQVLSPWTHIAVVGAKSSPAHPKAAAPPVVTGPASKVEDATKFQIYYGQSFKVVKNNWNGKSYLLMQNTPKMATKTKYCTGRIKSFVIPLANYSVDTTASPVSFFELLGVLQNLKGITSHQIASQCVLQSYTSGNVQLVSKTDTEKFTQFSAHFMSNTDEGCNFAAYVPSEKGTPFALMWSCMNFIIYVLIITIAAHQSNSSFIIKTNYLCLSKAAANLSTRFKPIAAWIELTQKCGNSCACWHLFHKQYVTDAGAEVVDPTITNRRFNISDPEDMDNFHAILCTVDVVIDQTYASDPAEYKLSTFLESINVGHDSCFSFVANHSIWRFDKRIGHSKKLGNWSYLSCFSMLYA
ncbi:hypothetical protein ABZP36_006263 [Zizania latifolia]